MRLLNLIRLDFSFTYHTENTYDIYNDFFYKLYLRLTLNVEKVHINLKKPTLNLVNLILVIFLKIISRSSAKFYELLVLLNF